MPKFWSSIPDDLRDWCLKQPLFYVASAPLNGDHINISPKGYLSRSFAILNPNQCAYIDASGSGAETISHLYENGRVTVMFCSFDEQPRIVRFFCRGRVIERVDPKYSEWVKKMGKEDEKEVLGARAIIVMDVFKAQWSCGFGVPLGGDACKNVKSKPGTGGTKTFIPDGYEERDTMDKWSENQLNKGKMLEWNQEWNSKSLDGVPGLRFAIQTSGKLVPIEIAKHWLKRTARQWDAILAGMIIMGLFFSLASRLGVVSVSL